MIYLDYQLMQLIISILVERAVEGTVDSIGFKKQLKN